MQGQVKLIICLLDCLLTFCGVSCVVCLFPVFKVRFTLHIASLARNEMIMIDLMKLLLTFCVACVVCVFLSHQFKGQFFTHIRASEVDSVGDGISVANFFFSACVFSCLCVYV